jgi:hypothetical protein
MLPLNVRKKRTKEVLLRLPASLRLVNGDSVYYLLATREPYDESVFANAEKKQLQRMENRLRIQAQALGYTLLPPQPRTLIVGPPEWSSSGAEPASASPVVTILRLNTPLPRKTQRTSKCPLQPSLKT